MSSIAATNSSSLESPEQMKPVNHEREMETTNHDLPARTLLEQADEEHHDHLEREDPATMAASEELKHTTISDKVLNTTAYDPTVKRPGNVVEDKDMEEPAKASTPEPETHDTHEEELRERLSSPKKKRGRDTDDDTRDVESIADNETGSSVDGAANGRRTIRSEPEKKRPRDTSLEPTKQTQGSVDSRASVLSDHFLLMLADLLLQGIAASDSSKTQPADVDTADKPSTTAIFGSGQSDKAQTSSSAFAKSGFASLASSRSVNAEPLFPFVSQYSLNTRRVIICELLLRL